jgi:hypothetical protein
MCRDTQRPIPGAPTVGVSYRRLLNFMHVGLGWLHEKLTQGCILVQANALHQVRDARVTRISCSIGVRNRVREEEFPSL